MWRGRVLGTSRSVRSISGFIFPHKISYFLEESLSDELIKSYRDDLDFQNLIDLVQEEFKCCGISSQGFRQETVGGTESDEIFTATFFFPCRDWSKNEYFNCTANPKDNPSVERCGVPFSCCISESNRVSDGTYTTTHETDHHFVHLYVSLQA